MRNSLYDYEGKMRFPKKGGWQSSRFGVADYQQENDNKNLMEEFKNEHHNNLQLQDEDSYNTRFKVKPQTTVSFVAAPYSPTTSASGRSITLSPRGHRGEEVDEYYYSEPKLRSLSRPPQRKSRPQKLRSMSRPPERRSHLQRGQRKFQSAILERTPYSQINTPITKRACTTDDLFFGSSWEIEGVPQENQPDSESLSNSSEPGKYVPNDDIFNVNKVLTFNSLSDVNFNKNERSKNTRKAPLKSTRLPSIEEMTQINHFKRLFPRSKPTSIILTGNWRIPVHPAAFKATCPVLVQKMIEFRDSEEKRLKAAPWKPFIAVQEPRKKTSKKHVRRFNPVKTNQRFDVSQRLQELKNLRKQTSTSTKKRSKPFSGTKKKLKPLSSANAFKIDAPPRSVVEFLNFIYPTEDIRMGTFKKPTEVIGFVRLCVEYEVWEQWVSDSCCERLRGLISEEKLEVVLSLLQEDLSKEFEAEVVNRLGKMLMRGEITDNELSAIDTEAWLMLLTAPVWDEELSPMVNFRNLVAQVLIWVTQSEGVTADSLATMLDRVSGFPNNSDSCRLFGMAVHAEKRVTVLTKNLSPELQISFWRKVSEYFYTAAKTMESLSHLSIPL